MNDATRSHLMSLPVTVAVGLNAVIGAGIFSIPPALYYYSGMYGLYAYIFVIAAAMIMAYGFGLISSKINDNTVFYGYAASWGGPIAGYTSYLLYVGGLAIALALLTKITGLYLHVYFPTLSPEILGIGALAIFTLLNSLGARLSQVGNILLMILTILPILLICGLCVSRLTMLTIPTTGTLSFATIFKSIKTVVFGFLGFEAIPALYDHVQNPQRTIPRAIVITIALVGALYFSFTALTMLCLPPELFTSATTPLGEILLGTFPAYSWLVHFCNWAIIITIGGTIHAMLWAVTSLSANFNKRIAPAHVLNKQTLLIGSALIIGMLSYYLQSIDFMFSLVGLAVVSAYGLSLFALVKTKELATPYNRTIGIIALSVVVIIALCALEGIISAW